MGRLFIKKECNLCNIFYFIDLTVKQEFASPNLGIDESLKKLGKVRLPTPSDGHCLLHTWSTGLSINKSRVEEVSVNELTEHYERYKHVICSGVDDIISKFINEKKIQHRRQ